MAKLNRSNLTDNSAPVPRGLYTVLIQDVDPSPSKSSGAEMLTLKCEIIKPQTVEAEGRNVTTAGRTFNVYLSFSEKAAARTLTTLEKLLDKSLPDEVDTEDIKIDAVKTLKSKVFRAALRPEPQYETVDGRAGGVQVKDANGQPIIRGYGISVVSFESAATEIGAPEVPY
jgi:hypothetical protein